MNTTINILLAIIAITLTASAEPNLLIETIITEQHAPAEPAIISRPRVLTTSGQEAIIQKGTLEYTVTATLLDNGNIDVRAVLTDKHKDEKLATTRIESQLGKVAELQVGQFAFHTKTSLAK